MKIIPKSRKKLFISNFQSSDFDNKKVIKWEISLVTWSPKYPIIVSIRFFITLHIAYITTLLSTIMYLLLYNI